MYGVSADLRKFIVMLLECRWTDDWDVFLEFSSQYFNGVYVLDESYGQTVLFSGQEHSSPENLKQFRGVEITCCC